MKSVIRILIAISFGAFILVSCNGSSQRKVSPSATKAVSNMTGRDIFIGDWKDKKNDLKLSVIKSNDSVYIVRAPARTTIGFMDISTAFNDGKLVSGKDWVILTYSDEKVKLFNGEEFERTK